MTQPIESDDEYGWLKKILIDCKGTDWVWNGDDEYPVDIFDEEKAEQQIISHIQQNYVPKQQIPTSYSADGRGWVNIDDVEKILKSYTRNSEVERIKQDLLYDLDEIDNKPWRVFRQLAAIVPEFADIYTDYEAFYAFGGGRKVRKLINDFKQTDDYKESGFPEKREKLSNKEDE